MLEALAPQLTPRPAGLTEASAAGYGEPAPAPFDDAPASRSAPGDAERAQVLELLGPHPVDIDAIARAAGLGARDVRIVLMELDLAGEIIRHGHQLVSRAPR